jgi:hypothetical protein
MLNLDLLNCLESVNLDNKCLMIGWLQILCDMFLTRCVVCIMHLFKIDTLFPSTIISIWIFLLNNGNNKYKCFFNTKI